MLKIFRAFTWMRWRIFLNSLERTGARDTLERFSLATEKLGPIMALLLLVPSALLLFVLGLTAGFGLATGGWSTLMGIVRGILFAVLGITCLSPLVLPMRDSSTIVRLLILPIPRQVLYIAQAVGALGDPWVVLAIPLLAGVTIGLAIGLHFIAAAVALLAGLGFLIFIIGLTTLASSVLQLLLRDRRRGDLVMMVVVLVLPLIGIIPQFLLPTGRDANGRRLTREERQALPPTRTELLLERGVRYVPSELYTRATNTAVVSPPYTVLPLTMLAAAAFLVHGLAFVVYRRLLDMPTSIGIRRAGAFAGLWDRTIPGLSEAASAVAFTQYRLALRTPRGRASMFTPVIVPLVLAGFAYKRGGDLPFTFFWGGLGLSLAACGAFTAILAIIPLALNQFAVDKAGFTRQMLSPLSIGELLAGKAVGNGLVALGPALFCFVAPALIFPGGPPALWLSLLLSVVSTYALFAPAAAAWSAIFPKDVDLNSIGTNGNAHQGAALLGMLSLIVSAAPPILLTLFAVAYLRRVNLGAVLLLGWMVAALALSQILFVAVRKLVMSRSETIAQYY